MLGQLVFVVPPPVSPSNITILDILDFEINLERAAGMMSH